MVLQNLYMLKQTCTLSPMTSAVAAQPCAVDIQRSHCVPAQALLPAQVMVAGRRLEALLEQAIDAQLQRCMFHNNHRVAVSLLTDYVAGAEQIPTRTVQARRWIRSTTALPV